MEKEITFNIRKRRLFSYLFICLLILFSIQIVASYLFIQRDNVNSLNSSLAEFTDRINHDLIFQNNTWDMSRYNADPLVPYPNSPNSFPLYIITNDGYVIERSKPIKGLLDASDFNRLNSFTIPQTITSPTNEHWRVMSSPLSKANMVVGVVGAAYYNPQLVTADIDKKLVETIQYINSHITYSNNTVSLKNFDIRNVPYDVSFEIVDKYNRVILNNGRFPSYIDPSYISKEYGNIGTRTLKDALTGDEYSVKTSVMKDKSNNPISVIVTAKSLEPMKALLHEYLVSTVILSILLLLPFSLIIFLIVRTQFVETKDETITERIPESIIFNKLESAFHINDQIVQIPYASNQYYLCDAIFSNPKKRWEQDELLEKFGETVDSINARKMYDAMLAINKKVNIKLIIYRNKTYRINPDLLPIIAQK